MTDDKRAVILVSGGMDSATAVYEAMERGYEPYFLHTSYGQETEDREYECASALAEEVDAPDFLHVVAIVVDVAFRLFKLQQGFAVASRGRLRGFFAFGLQQKPANVGKRSGFYGLQLQPLIRPGK